MFFFICVSQIGFAIFHSCPLNCTRSTTSNQVLLVFPEICCAEYIRRERGARTLCFYDFKPRYTCVNMPVTQQIDQWKRTDAYVERKHTPTRLNSCRPRITENSRRLQTVVKNSYKHRRHQNWCALQCTSILRRNPAAEITQHLELKLRYQKVVLRIIGPKSSAADGFPV